MSTELVRASPKEYLAAISSVKDTSGLNSTYLLMTGNSITLTPGTWLIHGSILFGQNSSPSYTYIYGRFFNSNGADSGSSPSGGTTSVDAGNPTLADQNLSTTRTTIHGSGIRKTVTANTTIYLVPFASMGDDTQGRISTYIYAERVI